MPKYTIIITKTAQKQLDKFPDPVANLLIETISLLGDNPRPHGYKRLKGRDGYRIRQGNYRIIYDVYDKKLIIDIIAVGDRKDIYE